MNRCWLISIALAGSGLAADVSLSLPTWSDASREMVKAESWMPGAGLLLEESETLPEEAPEVKPPTASEMTEELASNEIPDEFLDTYFASRPEGFLVDPQGLLSPSDARDRIAFLNYHSEDSAIDFHVYVFGEEQQIPSDVRDEEISERLFGEGRPSLTLFYYLGAPDRSEIFLSPGLTDAVSDAERRRILQSSVLAASEKSDVISQLEAFCVQTSIRIYWIEKAAGLVPGDSPTQIAALQLEPEVSDPTRVEAMKNLFGAFWWKWGAVVSTCGAGLLIAISAWLIARRRAQFRFPEFEVAGRLGGDHAAGIGAVIGFGSTTQSPSTQHSGVPDYFGGI